MKSRMIWVMGLALGLGLVFAGETAGGKCRGTELKPVGVRLYHFEIQGRTAAVAVWYPATQAGTEMFAYNGQVGDGTAYLEAAPDRSGAPYPLIVFSHGLGGCGYQSVWYVENLVRAGFVVAAMDHQDAAMCAMEGKAKITTGQIIWAVLKGGGELSKTVFILFKDSVGNLDFSYRPKDLSGLIDRALELNQSDPALKGMMAPSKIGASGHSLGGYTTMALAGGVYDCVDPAKWPAESCAKVDALIRNKSTMRPEDFDIRMMGEQTACCLPEMKGRRASFGDPRVSAALPLGPAVMFPDRAFPEVKMPVMIITGEGKFEVPFEPIQKAYADLAGPKYLLELKRVDHMTITDVAYKIVLARLVLPGFSSQYRTKKEIYENFSENFFNGYLKDDAAGREYIREAHYPLVNLSARP